MDGHVARIAIAPVKSLGLVHPDEVTLERGGVAGDRRFWLVDERGILFNGKRSGLLVRIRPEWDEGTRRLALKPVVAELYGRPFPSHRVLGPWQAAISRFAGRPLTLLWADGGAVDRGLRGGTVTLVSRASLERLGEEARAEATVDGRRFRMLFEIDGVGAHAEDGWLGARVRVGDAVLELVGDVGRCVVTSHDPDTGVTDLDTLGTLARYRPDGRAERLPFGVYGTVAVPGRVRVGDPVSPLEQPLLTAI